MRNMIPNRKEKGFTLIELVMVIVILGILAAFALPRFADFGTEAKTATINGAAGAVRSAAAIAHSRWIADGSDKTVGNTITLDGVTGITMSTAGYPTEDATGITKAAQLSDEFDLASGKVSLKNAANTLYTDCHFTYSDTDGTVGSIVDTCTALTP